VSPATSRLARRSCPSLRMDDLATLAAPDHIRFTRSALDAAITFWLTFARNHSRGAKC